MNRILNYLIKTTEKGIKTETFLKQQGYSNLLIIKLKQIPFGISMKGEKIFTNHILKTGDILNIQIPPDIPSEHIVPTKLDFEIIFEDEDILVVNKPIDMPIHPSQGNFSNTLANALVYYYQQQNTPFVFRVMNRLDRNTSGLVLIAKNPLSACILSKAVKERRIKRTYQAIVSGIAPDFGTINAPIARVCDSTIQRCVDFERGSHAITHYKKLSSHDNLSLVCVKLETGRTHQIRVHFQYINHPLIGDYLYHPDFSKINRQALHSYQLKFNHPISSEEMEFSCPLPTDMLSCFPTSIN